MLISLKINELGAGMLTLSELRRIGSNSLVLNNIGGEGVKGIR